MATEETELDDLLLLWEEALERGESPRPEELCRARPELTAPLRRRIEALRDFDPLLGPAAETLTNRREGPPGGRAAPPTVPGYEVVRELGRGGMGVVYLARQVRLNRPVALKLILAGGHAGASERARFRVEAEAVAHLRHPNIVQVYETGEHEGALYFSLEFVAGGTLADLLRGRPQGAREAAGLVEALAGAMHHAHQRGVVHRDLKPSNVLLDRAGDGEGSGLAGCRPKVADFGLAKRLDLDSSLTGTGNVLGTPSYMAPEQADGRLGAVGPAADVYALGGLLYELITGRPPFRGATAVETLRQVVDEPPVPPTAVQPRCPRDLETVCLKCLEKDPRRRYADAAALAEDLRRFAAGEPTLARPVGAWGRAWRWARRRPALAAALGLSVLLLVGLTAVSVRAALAERAHARDLGRSLDAAKASRSLAELRLAESDRDRGLAACEQHDAGLGLLWMARGLGDAPAGARDLRRFLLLNLAAWSERVPAPGAVVAHDGGVVAVALSPDGLTCASAGLEGTVRLWETATGKPLAPPIAARAWALAFGPDGKRLATGGEGDEGGEARLWDAATARPVGTLMRHDKAVRAVAFAPDGRTVLTGSDDHTARLWDGAAGRAAAGPFAHPAGVTAVGFGPDGKSLLVWGGDTLRRWPGAGPDAAPVDSRLPSARKVTAAAFRPGGEALVTGTDDGLGRLWAVPSGAPGEPFRHLGAVWSLAFSGDGAALVSGSLDRTARPRDAGDGRPEGPPLLHPDYVTAVALDRAGRALVTGCRDGRARAWHLPPREPAGSRALAHAGTVSVAAFSPDGARVLTCGPSQPPTLWDDPAGQPRPRPLGDRPAVRAAFRPDGVVVATGHAGRTCLWDARTGAPLGPPLEHGGSAWALAFRPDGRTLVTACDDDKVRVWETATGRRLAEFPAPQFRPPVVSADGRTLLTALVPESVGERGTGARLFHVDDGRPVGPRLGHGGRLTALAFSPDGRACATGSDDRTARLWDAADGRPLGPPLALSGAADGLAFSPDGSALATACDDGVAQLWVVATGRPLGAALRHARRVSALAFSPDGRWVLTGSYDATARLWDAASGLPVGPPSAARRPGRLGRVPPRRQGGPDRRLRRQGPPLARPHPARRRPGKLRAWAEALTGMALEPGGAARASSPPDAP